MKKYILLIMGLLILLYSSVYAEDYTKINFKESKKDIPDLAINMIHFPGVSTILETFLQENGFETQTYDDDWTTPTTACDYDKATTGLSLEQDEAMDCSAGDDSQIVLSADADDVYVSFAIRWDTVGSGSSVFLRIYTSAPDVFAYVRLSATNHYMQVYAHSSAYSTLGTTSVGLQETSYVMLRCQKGTGSDGRIDGWVWDGDSWEDQVTRSDGTVTDQIRTFRFENNYGGTEHLYIDNFKEKATIILDPTTDTP